MSSEALQRAREYEAEQMSLVPKEERAAFHVTASVGWLNDPNGFSVYRGEYHLFYQYHPYSSQWGPMHWGHVKTRDFVRWERLPAALAPDSEYDRDGCWSGSAAELPDGRQMLLYTGRRVQDKDGKAYQAQCVAVGDGLDYEKYEGNPVLRGEMISTREFPVRRQGGEIKLRFVLDRHSLELFVNDGEEAASLLLYTPESADTIRFASDGGAVRLNIEKYDIVA